METTKEKPATFTPGPWVIEDCTPGESEGLRFAIESKHTIVARTTDGWNEARANARLIASAPEMYELLVRISQGNGYDSLSLAMDARELLAKVEGGEG